MRHAHRLAPGRIRQRSNGQSVTKLVEVQPTCMQVAYPDSKERVVRHVLNRAYVPGQTRPTRHLASQFAHWSANMSWRHMTGCTTLPLLHLNTAKNCSMRPSTCIS